VARDSKPEAKPMQFHKGWSYETRKALYQLWPPDPSPRVGEPRTDWTAGWTERRETPVDYLDDEDDEDDGWRPEVAFAHGTAAEQALACFPTSEEAAQAKRALLRAAHARVDERASIRRRSDCNYEGVLKVGQRVVWSCEHTHLISRGYRPPWHGTMTALACAEKELERRRKQARAEN
jgi:hypothetical protein